MYATARTHALAAAEQAEVTLTPRFYAPFTNPIVGAGTLHKKLPIKCVPLGGIAVVDLVGLVLVAEFSPSSLSSSSSSSTSSRSSLIPSTAPAPNTALAEAASAPAADAAPAFAVAWKAQCSRFRNCIQRQLPPALQLTGGFYARGRAP